MLFGTRSCLEGLKKRSRNGKLSASNDAFAKAVDEPLSGNDVDAVLLRQQVPGEVFLFMEERK